MAVKNILRGAEEVNRVKAKIELPHLTTTVSFCRANLSLSPDNEEEQISIPATHKGCTLQLLRSTLQLAPAHHHCCCNWHGLQ